MSRAACRAQRVARTERVARSGGPLPIIGFSGNAGSEAHDQAAKIAGQDAVWGKPQPSLDEMRLQLTALLARV